MEKLTPENTISTKSPNNIQYNPYSKMTGETYGSNQNNKSSEPEPKNNEDYKPTLKVPKINMTERTSVTKAAIKDILNRNLFRKETHDSLNQNPVPPDTEAGLGSISSLLLKKQPKPKELISRRKTNLEDFYHTKYVFNCKVQFFLSVVTILTCILEYECTVYKDNNDVLMHSFKNYPENEIDIDPDYKRITKRVARLCSILTFIISIFLWISIYYDFILIEILKKGVYEKTSKIIMDNKKETFYTVLTILFFFLCPNPFTFGIECNIYSHQFFITYKIPLNSIFTSICLFRTWFVFKYYLVSSTAYNQRSFRICKMNGVNIGLQFPFKANMAQESLIIDLYLLLLCWLVSSYNLRIYERYVDKNSGSNFDNFYNDLWCVFISMTTVGYGDMSPTTDFGRVFIMISCLSGVFIVGLVVVSVTGYLNITGIDLNVYKVLEKSNKLQERKDTAIDVIAQFLKYRKKLLQKKEQAQTGSESENNKIRNTENDESLEVKNDDIKSLDEKKVKQYRKKIKGKLNDFKGANDDYKQTIPPLNDFDNIAIHLKFLEENVAQNQKKIDEILSLLDQLNSAYEKSIYEG